MSYLCLPRKGHIESCVCFAAVRHTAIRRHDSSHQTLQPDVKLVNHNPASPLLLPTVWRVLRVLVRGQSISQRRTLTTSHHACPLWSLPDKEFTTQ